MLKICTLIHSYNELNLAIAFKYIDPYSNNSIERNVICEIQMSPALLILLQKLLIEISLCCVPDICTRV